MTDYTVIRSRRRTLALEVTRQGTALVRAPCGPPMRTSPALWTVTAAGWKTSGSTAGLSIRPPGAVCGTDGCMAAAGKETLPPLVAHWAQRMGVQPAGITVTAARTRFGSCSGKTVSASPST